MDAVIWTNLKSNFRDKSGFAFTEEQSVNYLKHLTVDKKNIADEYIGKASNSVRTPLRKKIEEEMKWYPM